MPWHSPVASLAGNASSGYAVGPIMLGAMGVLGRSWLEADRTSELQDLLEVIKDALKCGVCRRFVDFAGAGPQVVLAARGAARIV